VEYIGYNRKDIMTKKITQKQYNDLLENLTNDDWNDIRKMVEEKLPEVKNWPDIIFRQYSSAVVRSGFRKEGLN
jgi:hypothetical protein